MKNISHRLNPLIGQYASHAISLIIAIAITLLLALGFLQVVVAQTVQQSDQGTITTDRSSAKTTQAIPDPVNFMMGTVTFTWSYRNKNAMPFTEHHSISSNDVSDALTRNGPVRIATDDSGELLINTIDESPDLILSARRYADWTLISVLRNGDDPTSSAGVFKFCSVDAESNRCAHSVLQYPDGTVTMTNGSSNIENADMTHDLDQPSITKNLVALLSL